MKQFFGKHKFTVAVILAGVIGIPSLSAYNMQLSTAQPMQEVKTSVASVDVTPEPTVQPQETVAETQQPVQQVAVAPVVQAPVILSIQAYAEMYLDVFSPMSQECFDNIVKQWPERFTPEVREQNIKGLRSWASPCATQMMPNRNPKSTLIYSFGANGEYFDSELAKRNW